MSNDAINSDELNTGAPQATTPPVPARTYTEEEVNRIAGIKKKEGAERARKELEREYQAKVEELSRSREASMVGDIENKQAQVNQNVSRETNADSIYQQVQERFNREMRDKQLQAEMSTVANNYLKNMSTGKSRYEDFDAITKGFDPSAFPTIVFLVSGMDNAADIVYELSKNPTKLAAIDRLAEKSPQIAQSELAKLSASIADNQKAQKEASQQGVNEPLDRMQQSRISAGNGNQSIRDLRNQPWLRG